MQSTSHLKRLITALLLSVSLLGATAAQAHGGYYGYGGHRGHHGGGGWWGPALGVGLVLGSAAIMANAYSPPPRPPMVVVPGPVMVAPQQPTNVWYFCADSNSYYPQAQVCPSGWRVVPASPPPGY